MDTFAFLTTAPVAFKPITAPAVCAKSPAYSRPSTFAPTRSTFTGFGLDNVRGQGTASTKAVTIMKVTQAEVREVQKKWSDGVVKIGSLKDNFDECAKYSEQFLKERYAFDSGNGWVLFKPTKCSDQQFRMTKPAAVSYFIAGPLKKYDEDSGFAVTPWTSIRWENTGFILENNRAIAMGNYYFTDTSGGETKVEYTFGYTKVDGDLKIDLHHSSLPFPKS